MSTANKSSNRFDSDDEPLSKKGKTNSDCVDPEDEPLANRIKMNNSRRSSIVTSETSSERSYKFKDDKDAVEQEPKWDKFCWGCHRRCKELHCCGCDISYHNNCIPDLNRGKIGWRCPECKAGNEWSNDNLGQYVIYVVERLTLKHGVIPETEGYTDSQLLHNPVTFAKICGMAQQKQYTSSHEFLLDMKWLKHNCEILYKYCSKAGKKHFTAQRNASTAWLSDCISQIEELRDCVDCYINRPQKGKFTSVCRKPHPILWAQFGVFPYWPCKFKKIVTKNGKEPLKSIEVVFFDEDYEMALVAYKDCYLYSEEDPNVYLTDQFKARINAAKDQADRYIKNVEKTFGPFKFAPLRTVPEHGQIDMLHLDQMIPGYRDTSLRPTPTQTDTNDDDKIHLEIDGDVIVTNSPSKPVDEMMDNHSLKKRRPEKQPCSKKEAESNTLQVRLPPDFMDRLKLCRDYFVEITDENDVQKLEILKLRTEVATLKDQNQALQEKHASEVDELKKKLDALNLKFNNLQETFL